MRYLRWVLVPCLCFSLAFPASAGEEPERQENDPYPEEFRERVDKAVDKGVDWLMEKQRADGSWHTDSQKTEHRMGVSALATLACLVGGVKADDPRIRQAFKHLMTFEFTKTYDTGVYLMALHAKYSVGYDESVEVDRYGERRIKDPCSTQMTPEDRKRMQDGVAFLIEHQRDGHWRYPEEGVDLSNTQYALLGLWAASRCGMRIPEKVWKDSLMWLLTYQERTGRPVELQVNEVRGDYRIAWTERAKARGFRYMPENPVTGAMTTAGMACLVICQDELWKSRRFTADERKASRRSIRDAMAWIQDNFDVTKNPGEHGGGWHYYYLYGLERAGVLARQRFMGAHDWYYIGANHLLDSQRSGGSWSREDTLLDTCFAILFLKRSSQRTRNPVITPSHD